MKTAIIGANFLGSTTAFYLRQALNSNRSDASEQDDSNDYEYDDEIVVFDQLPRTGGHKFNVLSLGEASATVGTASSLDVSSSPLLKSLLRDASLPSPPVSPPSQWSVFDWNADSYIISKYRSRTLSFLASSSIFTVFLQVFSLYSSRFFYTRLLAERHRVFLYKHLDEDFGWVSYVNYVNIIWFCITLFLAGGFVPLKFLFRLQNNLFQLFMVRVTSSVIYGMPSISSIYSLCQYFKDHLGLIDKNDSGTSCITLGHLLSACGFGKYAKQSTSEFLGPLHISENFLKQCASPPMTLSYADTSTTASATTNSLATMLSLTTTSPVPASLRSRPCYFSVEYTSSLCPSILNSADAKIHLNTRIVSVMRNGDNQYDLRAIVNDEELDVGTFDAVLIASVIDPKEFKSDALDSDVEHIFSLKSSIEHLNDPQVSLNTAKFVSLVRGEIKPSFFRMGSSKNISDQTYILNSVNSSEVVRISDNTWKITSSEEASTNSSVCGSIFDNVTETISYERPSRRYSTSPLRNLHGVSAPDLILARRFVNVAAIDRVCSDINMECIAAKNAASLFRTGVITWK